MRTALCLCLIVALAMPLSAAAPSTEVTGGGRMHSPLDTEWGPDDFGYIAKDSNEPDGPDFQWIDIEATGTEVTGLSDDNIVGPFPIGWSFRYYWYDVSAFRVGSNGYIRFSGTGQIASPFYQFEYPTYTDVLGLWIGDWFFGPNDPSICYYWSNGEDTLIVMWRDVTAWGTGGNLGNHDFELILSGVDSSITYMYGQSTTGDLYTHGQSRGFENITGQIGLSLGFQPSYPPSNYAVKIEYPDTITFAVNDLAIAGVQNNESAGFFLVTEDTLHPWLSVRNTGNQTENSYTARYSIRNASNNSLIASDDTTMGTIQPATAQDILFPPLWSPTAPGVFRAVGRVTLTGDDYVGNDSVRAELHVISLPGELFYDDGASEQGWGWAGGNGGMANEFVPPIYPAQITSIRIYIATSLTEGFEAQILDDDGTDGSPSTVLFSEQVSNPSGNAWSVIEVDPPVVIEDGAFFVGWMQDIEGITFGVDTVSTLGFAHRSWEYTGAWSGFRVAQADHLIRATIDFAGNNPPVITDYSPEDLDTVIQNSQVTFFVTAVDADDDPLEFSWTRNGTVVGTAPSVNITFPDLGVNTVMCIVTDGVDADSAIWTPFVIPGDAADDPNLLPTSFALHAAYPNPFNPATRIAYDIARASRVSLRVYNLSGELVSTLVDSQIEPGRYHAEWNASGQSSGTYFVIFDAADVHQVQKLLLLK